MTGSSPKSIQAKDESAPIALAAIQSPKTMIPTEIESENASFMMTSQKIYSCRMKASLSVRFGIKANEGNLALFLISRGKLADLLQFKEVCYIAIDAAKFASPRFHEHKPHRHVALRAGRRRGIFGHGISLSLTRELNTLSHRQQPKASNSDESPCAFLRSNSESIRSTRFQAPPVIRSCAGRANGNAADRGRIGIGIPKCGSV